MGFLRRLRGPSNAGFLRRPSKRASDEAMERYHADRKLAESYAQLRSGAELAERELRDAQAQRRPLVEIRDLNEALDHALGAALKAALAGQWATMGPKAYEDRIAHRRAMVRDDVRRWLREVSMLRTVRERFRLEAMSRTGTLVPNAVQLRTHAMSSPDVPVAESGLSVREAEELGRPPVGVDLDHVAGERRAHT